MPVFTITKTVYCGVVDYEDGDVVVWDLDWAPSGAGIAPVLDDDVTIPAGRAGIKFTHTFSGGGHGTATITATINGIPVGDAITCTTT